MSDKRFTALRPSGWTQLVDPELGTIESDQAHCVHCRKHWRIQPGSGKIRGFCTRCNGFTCGPDCHVAPNGTCVPFEKWLDCYEKGVDPATVTTVLGGWSPK